MRSLLVAVPLTLCFAACSSQSTPATTSTSTSGVPSATMLNTLPDAQKQQFCNWLIQTIPTTACQDATIPSARTVEACLANFGGFGKSCTVAMAEQCLGSTWKAYGNCQRPDTTQCQAFSECVSANPPTNDCPDGTRYCLKNNTEQGAITFGNCWLSWGCEPCDGKGDVGRVAACNAKYSSQCSGSCVACTRYADTGGIASCWDSTGQCSGYCGGPP
ncbi:MAG: hypothetical protein WCI05_06535 [Myxococcales bacterium]